MENKFKLDPGEPMALLHPVTKKRIRSTRDLPISDEQLQKDFARAAVVSICSSRTSTRNLLLKALKTSPGALCHLEVY